MCLCTLGVSYKFCLCRVNLELFKAKDVATGKVKIVQEQICVADLAALLLEKSHSHQGFPVVRKEDGSESETFCGFIHR